MIHLHSYPELLERKNALIKERKYFFRKYYSRVECELYEMFSADDRKKWDIIKREYDHISDLIETYRKDCRDKGASYI